MSEFVNIFLPDNSSKQLNLNSTGLDLANNISPRLAKESIGLNLNGKLADLNTVLTEGDKVKIRHHRRPQARGGFH